MATGLPLTHKQSSIIVVVTGQVESGYFPSSSSLYVRVSPWCHSSWQLVAGDSSLSPSCVIPNAGTFHLHLPISATFKGSSPFKWPQLVFSCYGQDVFGHDICRGYGSLLIPTVPGSHTREVACFVPESSSTLQKLVGWVTGRRAEFVDASIVTQSEGREVTRVSTQGLLRVRIQVMIRGTKQLGYDVIASSLSRVSDFPLPDFNLEPQTSRGINTATGQTLDGAAPITLQNSPPPIEPTTNSFRLPSQSEASTSSARNPTDPEQSSANNLPPLAEEPEEPYVPVSPPQPDGPTTPDNPHDGSTMASPADPMPRPRRLRPLPMLQIHERSPPQ